ncbi:pentapeptide repeat-containing protein [Morganella morganii]|uniref:pentapeptide repeat-containing protein n=1 Tax=Morganella morganii TaxID=582 RepID=UPI003BF9E455
MTGNTLRWVSTSGCCHFRGCYFRGCYFRCCHFRCCHFRCCHFRGCDRRTCTRWCYRRTRRFRFFRLRTFTLTSAFTAVVNNHLNNCLTILTTRSLFYFCHFLILK